jgi:uncharacterized membrane protein YgcG
MKRSFDETATVSTVLTALTALTALSALSASSALSAQTPRSLAIKTFDAVISVNRDASIDVSETITAEFSGSWNGIYRTIPVEYHTPQGFNWTLRLQLQGATDQSGQTLKVESSRERHYIKYKIWVPGAENATRTIVLHYRALNGLRFFPDHDELYWNVTGDEWDVPVGLATARIDLPSAATGVRAISFNGAYGSTEHDAKVEIQGRSIHVTMPKPLGFHEGLTAVVGWNKGAVLEPTKTDQAMGFLASNWPLGIPIVVFLGMLILWLRVGKDPRSLPIVVQYEPPDGMSPAEAGTLVDAQADMRDITATMVDLAVRGYLRIVEQEKPKFFGLMQDHEYVFQRLDPPAGAPPLAPHEEKVLAGIFEDGTNVELSDLENDFYRHLSGIRNGIFTRLKEKGLYRSRPDRVRSVWIAVAVVLAATIMALGASVGVARFNLEPFPVALAAVTSGLIVALFGNYMPARTVAGARALERVLGFEEFLRKVEGDRLQRVVKTPEMFERFLPFAMAFKVERRWAKAFQDIYREPPRWYVGSNASSFSLDSFSTRLADLSSRAEHTMSSSPRSSGGSGFSGGSSGGGSGGGGGGGF